MSEHTFLFQYRDGSEWRPAVQRGDTVYALDKPLDWLLTNVPAAELQDAISNASGEVLSSSVAPGLSLGHQEVWAAGVTYKRSEEARERESNNSTIYTRVYSAERPELFMKAIGYQSLTSGDEVGIRYDADWSVPEPELAIVLNSRLEVVGFTIANDMSSRDIEGENPLYLPQAKVYERSCALGPRIWLQPGAQAWPQLEIAITITRDGSAVFGGSTSTEQLHRTLADLVGYLGRAKRFTHGAVLLTGTGVVPPDEFTLQVGDEIAITIEPIGTLVNRVTVVGPYGQ